MKIMLASDAPWVASPFGTQARLLAPLFERLGHHVWVSCTFGLHGGPVVWNGISCLPRTACAHGEDLLAFHVQQTAADVAIVAAPLTEVGQPTVGDGIRRVPWFSVEADVVSASHWAPLRGAWQTIAASRFSERQARAFGLDPCSVPRGIDLAAFRSGDRAAARACFAFPAEAFVVGMTVTAAAMRAAECLTATVSAFSEFRRRWPAARLCVHTVGIDRAASADLVALCREFQCHTAVSITDPWYSAAASDVEQRATLFTAFDVLLQPGADDASHQSVMEAQAAGCPVIVGEPTAIAEACLAGWQVPRAECRRQWLPEGRWVWVPGADGILDCLERARAARDSGDSIREQASARAQVFDVARVAADSWAPVLELMAERVRAEGLFGRGSADDG